MLANDYDNENDESGEQYFSPICSNDERESSVINQILSGKVGDHQLSNFF
jgi:hypothetical protein